MNCALEDCYVLANCVERFDGRWEDAFSTFERIRRPDADAITELSDANYAEMSHRVVDQEFVRSREIERALQLRFPGAYVPLYAMISFSTLPYATAVARAAAQSAIVNQLVRALEVSNQLDLGAEWLRTAVEAVMDISPPA
jgi:kynurenine 3-monooxygenase